MSSFFNTTAHPAYASKEDLLAALRSHSNGGDPIIRSIIRRLSNTDTSGWADPTVRETDIAGASTVPTMANMEVTYSLAEGTDEGTVIATMAAKDADPYQTLAYSITAGDDNSDFAIDAATGEVSLSATFSGEADDVFTLTIRATDSEPTPRTVDATLEITLTA